MTEQQSLEAKILSVEALALCRDVLTAYPYKPYYYYHALPNEALTDYALEQQRLLIGRDDAIGIGVSGDGRVLGTVCCGRLEWDSGVIGVSAGFVGPFYVDDAHPDAARVRKLLLDQSFGWLEGQGVRHLTARLDVNEVGLLHLLEESGFITVDQILHFNLDLRRGGDSSRLAAAETVEGVTYRLHREGDVPRLREIAERAYKYDRFHADELIESGRADRAYGSWVENSCHGLADAVVVAEFEGAPVGFMTLKLNRDAKKFLNLSVGKIWLVGVAERMRGTGLARGLMSGALRWFIDNGADVVEVGTQLRNTAGMRFYVKCGLSPVNSLLALRRML